MSARDEMDAFLDCLGLSPMDRQKAQWLMADYAHELAEQQRSFVRKQAADPFHYGSARWAIQGVDEAANQIDPEVSK